MEALDAAAAKWTDSNELNGIRNAYLKLSAAEQALVSQAGLDNLDAAIAAAKADAANAKLTVNGSGTNAPAVDYKTQSAAISTASSYTEETTDVQDVYTIGQTDEGNLVVRLNLFEYAAWLHDGSRPGARPFLPGDSVYYIAQLVNNSGHDYRYKTGSLTVAPGQTQAGAETYGVGFDGQEIMYPTRLSASYSGISPAVFQTLTEGEQLAYLLDAINDANGTNYTSLSQVTPMDLTGLNRSLAAGKQGEYSAVLSQLNYNEIWNHLLAVSFSTSTRTLRANAAASDTHDTVLYSVGAYMRDEGQTLATGEDVLKSLFADFKDGQTVTMDQMQMVINGPMTKNNFQNYSFSGYVSFELERVDVDVPPVTQTHTVTVNYLEQNTNRVLYTQYVSAPMDKGVSYDVAARNAIPINGYRYVETTGDALQGTLDADKVINVWYTVRNTDRDDGPDEPPTVPDVPEVPVTEIPEEETPTAELPTEDIPTEDVPTEDILEDEVPLAEVPKTGDASMLWMGVSGAAAAGLAALQMTGRKRGREEDDD